jgi:type I restriction enzyme M protein
VDGHKLDAVIKLPAGVFKPYAGVATAILCFTKTNSGGTDTVWFYEVEADGFTLDDKRTALFAPEKLGPVPVVTLEATDHDKNNLPDTLRRWAKRNGTEYQRQRTSQSFCVARDEIAGRDYDLSMNRYKESTSPDSEARRPSEIFEDLQRVETEIQQRMSELKAKLK